MTGHHERPPADGKMPIGSRISRHLEGHIMSKYSQPVTGIVRISGDDSQDEKGDDMRRDGSLSEQNFSVPAHNPVIHCPPWRRDNALLSSLD